MSLVSLGSASTNRITSWDRSGRKHRHANLLETQSQVRLNSVSEFLADGRIEHENGKLVPVEDAMET
jgi:hypothetical protein